MRLRLSKAGVSQSQDRQGTEQIAVRHWSGPEGTGYLSIWTTVLRLSGVKGVVVVELKSKNNRSEKMTKYIRGE